MVQRFTDDLKNVKVVSNVRNVIQSFCNKMKTRLLKSSPHSIVKKCYFDVKVFGYFPVSEMMLQRCVFISPHVIAKSC